MDQQNMTEEQIKEYRKVIIDLIVNKLRRTSIEDLRQIYYEICGIVDRLKARSGGSTTPPNGV